MNGWLNCHKLCISARPFFLDAVESAMSMSFGTKMADRILRQLDNFEMHTSRPSWPFWHMSLQTISIMNTSHFWTNILITPSKKPLVYGFARSCIIYQRKQLHRWNIVRSWAHSSLIQNYEKDFVVAHYLLAN